MTDEPTPGPRLDAAKRRWDTDERGAGVGAARAHAATIDALRPLLDSPDWVAEEPNVHLLPNLGRAVAEAEPGWAIERDVVGADGSLTVDIRWSGDAAPSLRAIRGVAFALIGSVAESMTTVHQQGIAGGIEFEVITGVLPADTDFATHGHTLRLRLHGTGAEIDTDSGAAAS